MGFTKVKVDSTVRSLIGLSWPIVIDQFLRTLMRTVDILVTGLFSPAAVAAIGIADVFARVPLFLGMGFGSGTIALVSQDTGNRATENRNEVLSQALLIGILIGVPFAVFGLFFGEAAIAFLGTTPEVATMGGTYLSIVLATASARHISLISVRALQGTGDTRTPMAVRIVSNSLNIVGSVVLGLGLLGMPRLGIIGVGIATAVANLFNAVVFLSIFVTGYSTLGLTWPSNPIITRQLVNVSTPRIAEGWSTVIAEFPLNAILILFGTEVVAGYHVAVRIYKQFTGPFNRAFETGTSILVGQIIGRGNIDEARETAWIISGFATSFIAILSVIMLTFPEEIGSIFTQDEPTLLFAIEFTMAYAVAGPFDAVLRSFTGALQGGSETRAPFFARTSGIYVFLIGGSYVLGVFLDLGPTGVFISIVCYYVWGMLVVTAVFWRGQWSKRALSMISERDEKS